MSYSSRVYRQRNAHTHDEAVKEPFFAKRNDINKQGQRNTFFQAKLSVNEPGDKYEREADSVANVVVNQSPKTSLLQQKNADPEKEKMKGIQKKDNPLLEEDKKKKITAVQAKQEGTSTTASPQVSSKIENSSGKGNPLPQKTLHEMSSSFGIDFSGVNVHNDNEAIYMNKELQAQAFTHGSDIYFNQGKYNPENAEGKFLLAHELTHVVQQNNGISTKKLTDEKKAIDLTSQKYKDNDRLQSAFDNSPLLKLGECNEAVRLIQEGLVADEFAMPKSTNENGEMDGDFGAETQNTIMKFQTKHTLGRDGIVGRETLTNLDELANDGNLPSLTHLTPIKCHPKPPKEKPVLPDPGCKMHAVYVNQRTVNFCNPTSCGIAVQFDIQKISKNGLSCPDNFEGKTLNERVSVIEEETSCPHKANVITGSAPIEKNGTLNNATDTYGICFPKRTVSDFLDFRITHCDAVMKQELIIDGKVFEVRKIFFRVDFDIDFNEPLFIKCNGSASIS